MSHHVPIVPIIESQDYEKKLNLEFQSMDSEEFQLYKTANVEQYNLVKSANFEIVGKPKFPPKKKAKDPTEDEGNESSEKLEPKSLELMEELLRKGVSLEDMPEAILSMANKDLTELEKKQLCEIIQKGVSSGLTIEDIMKSQGKGMGEKSKEELEEMLRSGSSLSAVIKHFLTPNTTEEQTEQGFQDKMHRMLERQDLTQEEKLNVLFSNLKNDEKQLAEDWLKSGKSLEDIVQLLSDTRAEKESKRSVSEVLNDESLSLEEKFCLLKGNMNKKELDKIQNLIESGLSIDEALKAVAAEEDNESEFQKKIKSLAKGKDLNPTEMLELIKEYLSEDEMERCEEMMRNKYKTEDIIQYFLKFGTGRVITEFETLMRNMMEGKEMSDEEMLELLKSNLGPESLLKLEEMLGSGFSHSEVIKFLIRNGRTKEMEEKETKLNIENLLKDEDVSLDEKVKLVKGQLNEEAKFAMEELLKQGYKTEEVMDLFLRCANDISLLNSDGMFKKTVRFSDEPPDAFLYEARDVWSMIDQCEVKLNVPFMTNLSKCGTFTHFFGKVVKVTTGKDLTHREILDVIAFRLGGDFAVEFEELRYSGYRLQEIVDHFLMKDEAARLESMRRARLRANTRREAEVRLQRAAKRDNWGVRLSYCQSEEAGLQLRVDQVTELGPAYRSGLRAGNTIVTVDDWLITLMDRPQVSGVLGNFSIKWYLV